MLPAPLLDFLKKLPATLSDFRASLLPLGILAGVSVLSLVLGVWIPNGISISIQLGYLFMFVITALACVVGYQPLAEAVRNLLRPSAATLCTGGLILVCGLMMHAHERHEYKTHADEPIQVGVSQMMHLTRQAACPTKAVIKNGEMSIRTVSPDKRPYLYSFLVCVLHDLTGYRMQNAFVVNFLLTFVFLVLAYATGAFFAGVDGGRACVILFAGIPELARLACGGGFELLNITLMLACVYLGARHLKLKTCLTQDSLLMALLLLAYCRYESVLFLLSGVMVLAGVWWQQKRLLVSRVLFACPVLMIPYLLHNLHFMRIQSTFQMWNADNRAPFSLSHVPDQLWNLTSYFFSDTGDYANSWPIGLLGLFALAFCAAVAVIRLRRKESFSLQEIALAAWMPSFALLLLLMLSYGWELNGPLITRLNLPFYLPLVLALVFVMSRIPLVHQKRTWITVALAASITVGFGIPTMANRYFSEAYRQANLLRDIDALRERMGARPYVVIYSMPTVFITMNIPSIRTRDLNTPEAKARIAYLVSQRPAPELLYFETTVYDPHNKRAMIFPIKDPDGVVPMLDEDYLLEDFMESYSASGVGFRVRRVKGVQGIDPARLPVPNPKNYGTTLENLL